MDILGCLSFFPIKDWIYKSSRTILINSGWDYVFSGVVFDNL